MFEKFSARCGLLAAVAALLLLLLVAAQGRPVLAQEEPLTNITFQVANTNPFFYFAGSGNMLVLWAKNTNSSGVFTGKICVNASGTLSAQTAAGLCRMMGFPDPDPLRCTAMVLSTASFSSVPAIIINPACPSTATNFTRDCNFSTDPTHCSSPVNRERGVTRLNCRSAIMSKYKTILGNTSSRTILFETDPGNRGYITYGATTSTQTGAAFCNAAGFTPTAVWQHTSIWYGNPFYVNGDERLLMAPPSVCNTATSDIQSTSCNIVQNSVEQPSRVAPWGGYHANTTTRAEGISCRSSSAAWGFTFAESLQDGVPLRSGTLLARPDSSHPFGGVCGAIVSSTDHFVRRGVIAICKRMGWHDTVDVMYDSLGNLHNLSASISPAWANANSMAFLMDYYSMDFVKGSTPQDDFNNENNGIDYTQTSRQYAGRTSCANAAGQLTLHTLGLRVSCIASAGSYDVRFQPDSDIIMVRRPATSLWGGICIGAAGNNAGVNDALCYQAGFPYTLYEDIYKSSSAVSSSVLPVLLTNFECGTPGRTLKDNCSYSTSNASCNGATYPAMRLECHSDPTQFDFMYDVNVSDVVLMRPNASYPWGTIINHSARLDGLSNSPTAISLCSSMFSFWYSYQLSGCISSPATQRCSRVHVRPASLSNFSFASRGPVYIDGLTTTYDFYTWPNYAYRQYGPTWNFSSLTLEEAHEKDVDLVCYTSESYLNWVVNRPAYGNESAVEMLRFGFSLGGTGVSIYRRSSGICADNINIDDGNRSVASHWLCHLRGWTNFPLRDLPVLVDNVTVTPSNSDGNLIANLACSAEPSIFTTHCTYVESRGPKYYRHHCRNGSLLVQCQYPDEAWHPRFNVTVLSTAFTTTDGSLAIYVGKYVNSSALSAVAWRGLCRQTLPSNGTAAHMMCRNIFNESSSSSESLTVSAVVGGAAFSSGPGNRPFVADLRSCAAGNATRLARDPPHSCVFSESPGSNADTELLGCLGSASMLTTLSCESSRALGAWKMKIDAVTGLVLVQGPRQRRDGGDSLWSSVININRQSMNEAATATNLCSLVYGEGAILGQVWWAPANDISGVREAAVTRLACTSLATLDFAQRCSFVEIPSSRLTSAGLWNANAMNVANKLHVRCTFLDFRIVQNSTRSATSVMQLEARTTSARVHYPPFGLFVVNSSSNSRNVSLPQLAEALCFNDLMWPNASLGGRAKVNVVPAGDFLSAATTPVQRQQQIYISVSQCPNTNCTRVFATATTTSMDNTLVASYNNNRGEGPVAVRCYSNESSWNVTTSSQLTSSFVPEAAVDLQAQRTLFPMVAVSQPQMQEKIAPAGALPRRLIVADKALVDDILQSRTLGRVLCQQIKRNQQQKAPSAPVINLDVAHTRVWPAPSQSSSPFHFVAGTFSANSQLSARAAADLNRLTSNFSIAIRVHSCPPDTGSNVEDPLLTLSACDYTEFPPSAQDLVYPALAPIGPLDAIDHHSSAALFGGNWSAGAVATPLLLRCTRFASSFGVSATQTADSSTGTVYVLAGLKKENGTQSSSSSSLSSVCAKNATVSAIAGASVTVAVHLCNSALGVPSPDAALCRTWAAPASAWASDAALTSLLPDASPKIGYIRSCVHNASLQQRQTFDDCNVLADYGLGYPGDNRCGDSTTDGPLAIECGSSASAVGYNLRVTSPQGAVLVVADAVEPNQTATGFSWTNTTQLCDSNMTFAASPAASLQLCNMLYRNRNIVKSVARFDLATTTNAIRQSAIVALDGANFTRVPATNWMSRCRSNKYVHVDCWSDVNLYDFDLHVNGSAAFWFSAVRVNSSSVAAFGNISADDLDSSRPSLLGICSVAMRASSTQLPLAMKKQRVVHAEVMISSPPAAAAANILLSNLSCTSLSRSLGDCTFYENAPPFVVRTASTMKVATISCFLRGTNSFTPSRSRNSATLEESASIPRNSRTETGSGTLLETATRTPNPTNTLVPTPSQSPIETASHTASRTPKPTLSQSGSETAVNKAVVAESKQVNEAASAVAATAVSTSALLSGDLSSPMTASRALSLAAIAESCKDGVERLQTPGDERLPFPAGSLVPAIQISLASDSAADKWRRHFRGTIIANMIVFPVTVLGTVALVMFGFTKFAPESLRAKFAAKYLFSAFRKKTKNGGSSSGNNDNGNNEGTVEEQKKELEVMEAEIGAPDLLADSRLAGMCLLVFALGAEGLSCAVGLLLGSAPVQGSTGGIALDVCLSLAALAAVVGCIYVLWKAAAIATRDLECVLSDVRCRRKAADSNTMTSVGIDTVLTRPWQVKMLKLVIGQHVWTVKREMNGMEMAVEQHEAAERFFLRARNLFASNRGAVAEESMVPPSSSATTTATTAAAAVINLRDLSQQKQQQQQQGVDADLEVPLLDMRAATTDGEEMKTVPVFAGEQQKQQQPEQLQFYEEADGRSLIKRSAPWSNFIDAVLVSLSGLFRGLAMSGVLPCTPALVMMLLLQVVSAVFTLYVRPSLYPTTVLAQGLMTVLLTCAAIAVVSRNPNSAALATNSAITLSFLGLIVSVIRLVSRKALALIQYPAREKLQREEAAMELELKELLAASGDENNIGMQNNDGGQGDEAAIVLLSDDNAAPDTAPHTPKESSGVFINNNMDELAAALNGEDGNTNSNKKTSLEIDLSNLPDADCDIDIDAELRALAESGENNGEAVAVPSATAAADDEDIDVAEIMAALAAAKESAAEAERKQAEEITRLDEDQKAFRAEEAYDGTDNQARLKRLLDELDDEVQPQRSAPKPEADTKKASIGMLTLKALMSSFQRVSASDRAAARIVEPEKQQQQQQQNTDAPAARNSNNIKTKTTTMIDV